MQCVAIRIKQNYDKICQKCIQLTECTINIGMYDFVEFKTR